MLSLLGEWTRLYPFGSLLLVLMIFDIITGLMRAIEERKLSSDINGRGMRRKATMLILVLLGKALERTAGDAPIAEAIAVGFCISEGLSILENATLLGAPVPPFLTKLFMQLQAVTAANQKAFRMGDSPQEHTRILEERALPDPHTKNDLRPDITEQALDQFEKDGAP